jgi:ribosomal protein L11 methyltransferase
VLGLVVAVPAAEVELASDALWELGVVAIEERAGAHGQVELWTSLGDDPSLVHAATVDFPPSWACRTVALDVAVADRWRADAQPTVISDDLVFCPAWVDASFPAGVTVVQIEPGATFGMGDHPTTVLTMQLALAHIRPLVSVLDVGCGSGVLSVAACMLGASRAFGIDIAPAAVGVTEANAYANGVADRVTVSTTPLVLVEGQFDVVLANILAPALIELAPHLRRVLAPEGVLIISGILAERHQHVLDALAPLRVVRSAVLDVWTAIELHPPHQIRVSRGLGPTTSR